MYDKTSNGALSDNPDETASLQIVKDIRRAAAAALQREETQKAHLLLCKAKELKTPVESIDYLRALAFLKNNDSGSAREALKEELRYFPQNQAARDLLSQIAPPLDTLGSIKDEEFKAIYKSIRPYTMVGTARLHALYTHAREICCNGPAGNFVECGVAGGGSSGLLSYVIKKYDAGRRLFACDSFSGMPPSTEFDIHNGQSAEDSGWGTGTCAAPESSVLNLCRDLGTSPIITTVKGYFEETLPVWKERFGPVAFLHMDGDWYSSTKAILENLYDILVPGAYIQIDDFGHWDGCRKAVTDFFISLSISLNFNNIDGVGVWFQK